MIFVLSLDNRVDFDEIVSRHGGELMSTGCGSTEYTFPSEAAARAARHEFLAAMVSEVLEHEPAE